MVFNFKFYSNENLTQYLKDYRAAKSGKAYDDKKLFSAANKNTVLKELEKRKKAGTISKLAGKTKKKSSYSNAIPRFF